MQTGEAEVALIGQTDEAEQPREKNLTRKEKRRLATADSGSSSGSTMRKYRKDAELRLKSRLQKERRGESSLSLMPAVAVIHVLSKMVYEASRSGTPDQLSCIVELSIGQLKSLSPQNNPPPLGVTAVVGIDAFRSLCLSLFQITLAGVTDAAGLAEMILEHAAVALHATLNSSDICTQNAYIAKFLFIGLSEIAVAGVFSSDLHRVGIADHIKSIYQALDWPNSFRTADTTAHSNNSSEISVAPSQQVLRELYTELCMSDNSTASFWMHSSTGGPLTALWAHSVKQRKVRSITKTNDVSTDNSSEPQPIGIKLAKLGTSQKGDVVWQGDSPLGFSNMNAPLVVDVGCGFGVSLLGLAAAKNLLLDGSDGKASSFYSKLLPAGEVNFLGCDLSSHCVAYASAIARKWKIGATCRFCVAPAESFLEWVLDSYPGPVLWVNIQFPTPYKLDGSVLAAQKIKTGSHKAKKTDAGKASKQRNVQLPGIHEDNGFMITPKLVSCAVAISQRSGAILYFQSNVEDVAVLSRGMFENCGSNDFLATVVEGDCVNKSKSEKQKISRTVESNIDNMERMDSIPNRKIIWQSMGGMMAQGKSWLTTSPVPMFGRTETEVVYQTGSKPVYRFAWKPKDAV